MARQEIDAEVRVGLAFQQNMRRIPPTGMMNPGTNGLTAFVTAEGIPDNIRVGIV
jgi:hypothetical protein